MTLGAPTGLDQWLARRFDVEASLLVDSGTSALRLAIQAAAPPGSTVRVALPAYGCFDLATAAIGAGAVVSFYDVDPSTLGPDWPSLGDVIAAGIDALVLVHQYGIPVDIERARALAEVHGVLVIEDAAQGAGAWLGQRRLGARGDLGVLSFGRGKGMTAGGGGALLATGSRGRKLLEQSRTRLGAAGRRGAVSVVRLAGQAVLSHPLLYGLPARMPGLNLGDTPFHAPWEPQAIQGAQAGAVQPAAELADREAEVRRANAARLAQLLASQRGVTIIDLPATADSRPGWLRFPILLDEAGALATTGRHLGVAPGYPMPLPRLPQFRETPGQWPGASALAERLITLPTHKDVSDLDRLALGSLFS